MISFCIAVKLDDTNLKKNIYTAHWLKNSSIIYIKKSCENITKKTKTKTKKQKTKKQKQKQKQNFL